MNIAIFVPSFPSHCQVPILNLIIGLVKAGENVTIFADKKEAEGTVHKDIDKYKLLEKVIYIPQPPYQNHNNKIVNKLYLFTITTPKIIQSIFINPGGTLSSLNVFRFKSFASSFWLFYNASLFLRRKFSYDILHAQFGPIGEKVALLKELKLIQGELITSFRGYDINVVPKSNSIFNKYFYLKKNGNLFTANSNFIKQKLINYHFDETKIHIINSAILPENFKPTKKSATKDTLNLISVGRLIDIKGYKYSIKAIPELKKLLPERKIIYRIIGDGEKLSALRKLAEDINAQDVVFLGWKPQEEIIKYLDTSDIFIHPAIVGQDGAEEAQGLVIQEAQAMRLPVIASNIGGIPEGLIDGETGYIVNPKEPFQIASCIAKIVKGNKLELFGDNARKFVLKNYNQNIQIQRLQKIYSLAYCKNCNYDTCN